MKPEEVFELPPVRRKKPIIPETPVVAVDTAIRLEAEVSAARRCRSAWIRPPGGRASLRRAAATAAATAAASPRLGRSHAHARN
jgi:hypothetical protein